MAFDRKAFWDKYYREHSTAKGNKPKEEDKAKAPQS